MGPPSTRIVGGSTSTDLPVIAVFYPSDHAMPIPGVFNGWTLRPGASPFEPGVLLASYNWSQDAERLGNEYERHPSDKQKQIVNEIAKLGADIIIGSHPHVIQPMETLNIDGRKVFVAYSVGNFISNQYWRYSTDGLILNMEITKIDNKTEFKNINYIPTAVVREYHGSEIKNEAAVKLNDKSPDFITGAISHGILKGNEVKFRVLGAGQALYDYQNKIDKNLTDKDYIRLKTTWEDTTSLIGESGDYKIYRDEKSKGLVIGQKREGDSKAMR
jgi:hypothetical protein